VTPFGRPENLPTGPGAFAIGCRAIVSFHEQPPLLRCSGDEDRSTQSLRRRALSRALKAPTDVSVDLSELVFADSSLMLDLVMVARRLRKHDHHLVLHSAQPQIHRLIELVGIDRLPGVVVEQRAPVLA
jgi:anti-anti-sigma factor